MITWNVWFKSILYWHLHVISQVKLTPRIQLKQYHPDSNAVTMYTSEDSDYITVTV